MRLFCPRCRNDFPRSRLSTRAAFSLIEVLVSMAMVLIILVTLLEFVGEAERVSQSTSTDPYATAENAFETITRQVTTATLETYHDYADHTGAFRTSPTQPFTPDHLAVRSDLDFVCAPAGGPTGLLSASGRITTGDTLFFAAPTGYTQTLAHDGMQNLVNALGYFVEFGDADAGPSFVVQHAWRWRLKQVRQPSESLQIYATQPASTWIQSAVQSDAPVATLAENVIALVVLPERAANDPGDPLAPDFHYDSRDTSNATTLSQLPARLRVALMAIDDTSAQVMAARHGSSPPPLVPDNLFHEAAKMDADLATLDQSLTSQKIGHRLFQRTLSLPAALVTTTP